ncbi:hypothetical protein T4E_7285 [Trichinella pseudospiralis]|uniref:Uncharacterized protein n=1 Tax=Trichinella pseudospiralis TaxID=6337 RepID=A0A0V0Y9H2_TRIPS|nr:hypothetical protein T4E_7285 [Trichinella pseudospiralis]
MTHSLPPPLLLYNFKLNLQVVKHNFENFHNKSIRLWYISFLIFTPPPTPLFPEALVVVLFDKSLLQGNKLDGDR